MTLESFKNIYFIVCIYIISFKRPVTAVKYMPIDILMKENIDFYFEFE